MDQASFVPPSPLQLQTYLEAWQKYVESNDIDLLLQAAVMHAQFELLHPFKDGNGRIGRILIPLFLYQKKKLSQPMFYLSAYLENHREEYYQRLKSISQDGDWNGWIVFFLQAITEQAKINSLKVKAIMGLYADMKSTIYDITHSQYTIHLLDAVFDRPIFDTTDLITRSKINKKTAMALLKQLKDQNILSVLREGSGRKASVLCFPKLLNIAEGKEII
ncbi:MAG: Fic family protein [Silvanigrellaceae bacterium]|nr:Fic family protein [Silvanigrellaceae bacterium]